MARVLLTLGSNTGLTMPHESLVTPCSATVIDDTVYVSFTDSEPAGASSPNDVLAYTVGGEPGWWRMLDANGLWDPRAHVTLTAGRSGGQRVLYVAAEDRLRRISADEVIAACLDRLSKSPT